MIKPVWVLVTQGVRDRKLWVGLYTSLDSWVIGLYETKVTLLQDGKELGVYSSNEDEDSSRYIKWIPCDDLDYDPDSEINYTALIKFDLMGLDNISTAEIKVEIIHMNGTTVIEPVRVPVNPYFIKEKKEEGE